VTGAVCVLSGGGAKAAAHLGALRALTEHGLTPTRYVATSMGALVAAALASGIPPGEALRIITGLRLQDVAAPTPRLLLGVYARSLFRADPFRRAIARLVPAHRFADLATPLTVTAVDLETGDLVLFGAGGRDDVPLADALFATCALPLYYPPAMIGGRPYVDGGLRQVLPLDAAAGFDPDVIFAVDVGPSWRETPPDRPARVPPLVRRSGQVQRVLMAALTEEQLARWTARPPGARPELILVQPPVRAETTFRLDLAAEYEAAGYRAATSVLGTRPANG